MVVVIGGAHSNNTHELVKTCAQFCVRVHHVQTAGDLLPDWFHATDTVGITAGTSTPDAVISGVEQWLQEFAQNQVAGIFFLGCVPLQMACGRRAGFFAAEKFGIKSSGITEAKMLKQFLDDFRGRFFTAENQRVRRRFEDCQLAVQQRRGHEMALPVF